MGVGFNALLVIYWCIVMTLTPRSGDSFMNIFIAVTSAGLLTFGSLLFFWLRRWRWIHSAPRRWRMVVWCYILVLFDIVVFTSAIR